MDSAPEFLDLFVEPTGELIYFLAVIAISQATLFMALGQRLRGPNEIAAGRYTLFLLGVVFAWLAMGVGGLYALITNTADEAILPPLERAVNALVILLAGTALLTADSDYTERGTRGIVSGAILALIAAYAYTAITWHDLAADDEFNHHILGYVWTFGPALLLVLFVGMALFSRYRTTADIPLKLLYFVILLLGYSYTTAQMSAEDLDEHTSGALRLAFLTATPIITIIIYRLVLDRLTRAIDEVSEYAEAVSRPLQTVGTPPPKPPGEAIPALRPASPAFSAPTESVTLLTALGVMLEQDDPDVIPRQIAQAVATVLKADVAVLVSHEDTSWADVMAAYDTIQNRLIPGLALNLEEQPTILNAIERKAQRPLYADRNLNELVDLYTRLDISQVGPAYIQPLIRNQQTVAIVIVGQPYTSRELNDRELTLLEGLGPIAARLLSLSRAAQRGRFVAEDEAIQAIVESEGVDALDADSVRAVRQEMQSNLELAQQQIAELSRMVRDLQVELDYERSRMAQLLEDGDEAMTISQRIEVLSRERQELAAEREALSQALQEAQATLVSATAEDDEDIYSSMIATLRRERDELQVEKSKLQRNLDDIRSAREQAVPTTLREMLDELSEEKTRLTSERDQIRQQLEQVNTQLRDLGIEDGPLALAQAMSRITDERNYYKQRAEQFAQERDLLKTERKQLEDRIQHEAEREAQITALEADIRRLATDREALIKQRNAARGERDGLLKARDEWLDKRARLLGELDGLRAEMDDAVSDLNRLTAEKTRWIEQRGTIEAARDQLKARVTALQTERDQLLARVQGDRDVLQQVGADGVGAMSEMIESLTAERRQLEVQLAEANRQIELFEHRHARPSGDTQHTRPIAPENADVIMSIAQELRTPMSSITGYTDLLLSESVGILGALQRQFLQRVQANIDRLSNLITDLISITVLDSEDFKLEPITVDMLAIIEDAITAAGNQFREKSITLHMNLPGQMPPVRADRDAMHQVLIQLLSNAYLASPAEGEVRIAARVENAYVPPVDDDVERSPADMVHILVTDQGGGVPVEEQRRVFGRLYRADNPLIEGIGDTGVGLSIAKTLVEAHHGTIWLESHPGTGSTFHVALSLTRQANPASAAVDEEI